MITQRCRNKELFNNLSAFLRLQLFTGNKTNKTILCPDSSLHHQIKVSSLIFRISLVRFCNTAVSRKKAILLLVRGLKLLKGNIL